MSASEERIVGPVGVTAILALLTLTSVYVYKSSASPTESAKAGTVQSADASTAANATSTDADSAGGFWGWFSNAPPPPPPTPVKIDENRSDPRAATRVATFSCAGSLSAGKAAVCSNWGLAIMDYNMSLLMQTVMSQGSSPKSVRAAQKTWQRELDHLGGDPDKLRQHYQQRIDQLSKQI